ncbi:MAG: YraN family protein [Hyphomicrobiales bacterium]|nr:MAG: YraN family protein [Hyphomicrobiales bacterium]
MTPPAPARRAAYRLGLKAETLAAWWLRLRGYRILERRFKTPAGEIDLIARRGDTVAIVEVKARASRDAAIEAVTPRTRQRLLRAADIWLTRNPAYATSAIRFDIIAIVPKRLPHHIINAFFDER